ESGLQVGHLRANVTGESQSIRAGGLEHDDRDCRLVVEQRPQAVRSWAELDARDIAETRHGAVRTRLDDDVAEFLFVGEPCARDDCELIRYHICGRALL